MPSLLYSFHAFWKSSPNRNRVIVRFSRRVCKSAQPTSGTALQPFPRRPGTHKLPPSSPRMPFLTEPSGQGRLSYALLQLNYTLQPFSPCPLSLQILPPCALYSTFRLLHLKYLLCSWPICSSDSFFFCRDPFISSLKTFTLAFFHLFLGYNSQWMYRKFSILGNISTLCPTLAALICILI